jgi:CDP-glucose 4,6-dehydratase
MVGNFQEIFKGLRVLVTGDSGFKGSWLCEWLLLEGAEVFGIGLSPQTSPSHFELLCLGKRIDHKDIDIRDLASLNSRISKIKPHIIFHLAAQPLVRYSYVNPVETYQTNVIGTVNILECIRQLETICVGIFITTDKCYENMEWTHSYRECDPMGGHDPYSSSKGCCELVINSFRQSYFSNTSIKPLKAVASARAGNVIGGGDWSMDRIVPDCIRSLQSRIPVSVRNKNATRPWQHVLEPLGGYLLLAAELVKIVRNPEPTNERLIDLTNAFNFGPDLYSNRTVGELVEEMLKHFDGSWQDNSDSKAVHEASLLNLSIDKAYHKLGWRPKWNFQKSVKMTADWYKVINESQLNSVKITQEQIKEYMND